MSDEINQQKQQNFPSPNARIVRTIHCHYNETVEIVWRMGDDEPDYIERHDCLPKFVVDERRKKEYEEEIKKNRAFEDAREGEKDERTSE